MAAPVGGQIFSEVLPYLKVAQGNEEEVEKTEEVQTPDLVGKTIQEAEKILKESGLDIRIENQVEDMNNESVIIKEQTPKAGIIVKKGSIVDIKY